MRLLAAGMAFSRSWMASQNFSCWMSLSAFLMESSAALASASGSGGGGGGSGSPGRRPRHACHEVRFVSDRLPRVAQDLVGLPRDEDRLQLVPQIGEVRIVVRVGMEALGQAEVGVLDLRLVGSPGDAQDLELVAGLETRVGVFDLLAAGLGRLVCLVGGLCRGWWLRGRRGRRRRLRRFRKGGGPGRLRRRRGRLRLLGWKRQVLDDPRAEQPEEAPLRLFRRLGDELQHLSRAQGPVNPGEHVAVDRGQGELLEPQQRIAGVAKDAIDVPERIADHVGVMHAPHRFQDHLARGELQGDVGGLLALGLLHELVRAVVPGEDLHEVLAEVDRQGVL
jgi:hypothetical protein